LLVLLQAEVHPDELPDHLEEAMQLNIRVLVGSTGHGVWRGVRVAEACIKSM
jgi:hypothetical protein